jgi:hypothetical protein
MGKFKKKIIKLKCTQITMILFSIGLAVSGFVLWIGAIIPKQIEYEEFNNMKRNSENVKTEIYYLIGPIVETSDTEKSYKYYLAEGKNNTTFVIEFQDDETYEIPILGKDITNEETQNLDNLVVYNVEGKSEMISASLQNAIIEKLNNDFQSEVLNENNAIEFMGIYFINTAPRVENQAKNKFMIFLIGTLVALLFYSYNRKNRKQIDETLDKLRKKNKLEDVINDYNNGMLIEYKKVNVSLSSKYLYSYTNGLQIIEIKDIKDVYTTRNLKNNFNNYKYIIVETKNGEKYCIAPLMKKKQKIIFDELLAKIKTKI